MHLEPLLVMYMLLKFRPLSLRLTEYNGWYWRSLLGTYVGLRYNVGTGFAGEQATS